MGLRPSRLLEAGTSHVSRPRNKRAVGRSNPRRPLKATREPDLIVRSFKMRTKLDRRINRCHPRCFGFERCAQPGLHPATVVLGRNRKRIGCPGLRLQFVPAVRGQCGHLRGQSGHRSPSDGSGIDHLHVSATGATQVAARLSLKPRLIGPNESSRYRRCEVACSSNRSFGSPSHRRQNSRNFAMLRGTGPQARLGAALFWWR